MEVLLQTSLKPAIITILLPKWKKMQFSQDARDLQNFSENKPTSGLSKKITLVNSCVFLKSDRYHNNHRHNNIYIFFEWKMTINDIVLNMIKFIFRMIKSDFGEF